MKHLPWPMICMVAVSAWTASAHADIEVRPKVEISRSDGKVAKATAFSFESGAYRVRVLATSSHKTTSMQINSGVSIQQAPELPLLKSLLRREALVVNGGFSGSSTQIPVGLLITDGMAAAGPNFATRPAVSGSTCPLLTTQRLQHAGLLCVDPENRISIGRIDQVKYEECRQAIQAGPLVVEHSKVAVCPAEDNERRYARTVVCTHEQRVHVLLTEPLTLHELAVSLTSAAGPLKGQCTQALNLSGDSSSGAIYSYPASRVRPNLEVGRGTFPLPSMFVVSRR
jgi:uncharacterized protein YigE (DUF2233 family)